MGGEEPSPDLARELVHRGPAVAEVAAEHGARAGRARSREVEPRGQPARVGGRPRGALRRGPGRRGGGARRRHARHRCRRAVAAHQVAFRGELLVGQHHRVARHAEVPRERARGRHLRGGAEAAGADLGLERQVDAPVERPARLSQVQQHRGFSSIAGSAASQVQQHRRFSSIAGSAASRVQQHRGFSSIAGSAASRFPRRRNLAPLSSLNLALSRGQDRGLG